MSSSQKFYNQHHQPLLDARQRIEVDEQLRDAIQASNRYSQQFRSILTGHELDSIPVVIIREYAVSQQLMFAKSPFAQVSVAELERGLRVDRFLALGVRWLLREDLTVPASSPDTRILLNSLLIDVRRHAVAWLLKVSSLNITVLYVHVWTLFLNCALGRRACLHFQSPEKGAKKFSRDLLHPRGQPTIWRLIHWGESKSNTLYVDLEFGLVPELQIRRTFCYPKYQLQSLTAITFDGQDLLPQTFVSCQHIQEPAFWKHEDPYYKVPCGATSSVNLAPQNNSDAKSEEPQPRKGTEAITKMILATCEAATRLSDTSSDQGSRSRATQRLTNRRARSCSPPANTAIN
jgi:hypothetical protein